jgi:hypothetical protein
MKILVLERGIRREHCLGLLGNIVVSKADTLEGRELHLPLLLLD